MKVHEFMTTKIEFIDGNKNVYDAVERMVDRHIRSVLVRFAGKEGDYGVLTTRDIGLPSLSSVRHQPLPGLWDSAKRLRPDMM